MTFSNFKKEVLSLIIYVFITFLSLFSDEALELAQAQMRVIPMFEQNLYEYKIFKYYSLARNDLLRCRWAAFINSLEGRVKTPFIFPSYEYVYFNCKAMYDYSQHSRDLVQ